jgi:hypothetical protein
VRKVSSGPGANSRASSRTPTTGIVIWVGCAMVAAAWGQQECASCHGKQVRDHAATFHARAVQPVAESRFYRSLPEGPIGEARGGYLLTYRREGTGVRVTAERAGSRAIGLIEWVFGAGELAETPIVSAGGRFIEHRISYFSGPGKYDLTLGHKPGVSANATAALGIPQPRTVAIQCLSCHSGFDPVRLAVRRAGVECAQCHAGAAEHAKTGSRVVNPARLQARASVELCAACHRLKPPQGDEKDPLNIRFQPYRLVRSACFAGGGMSCQSCHEAHGNARRGDENYYIAKCRSCHQGPHRTDNCLPCHMPKSTPAPYLSFTDHYIRKPGL